MPDVSRKREEALGMLPGENQSTARHYSSVSSSNIVVTLHPDYR